MATKRPSSSGSGGPQFRTTKEQEMFTHYEKHIKSSSGNAADTKGLLERAEDMRKYLKSLAGSDAKREELLKLVEDQIADLNVKFEGVMSGNDDLEREYKKGIATIARQLTLMETTLKEEIPKVVNEHVEKGKRRAANLRKAKAVTPKKPRRYSGTSLYNDDDYDDDDYNPSLPNSHLVKSNYEEISKKQKEVKLALAKQLANLKYELEFNPTDRGSKAAIKWLEKAFKEADKGDFKSFDSLFTKLKPKYHNSGILGKLLGGKDKKNEIDDAVDAAVTGVMRGLGESDSKIRSRRLARLKHPGISRFTQPIAKFARPITSAIGHGALVAGSFAYHHLPTPVQEAGGRLGSAIADKYHSVSNVRERFENSREMKDKLVEALKGVQGFYRRAWGNRSTTKILGGLFVGLATFLSGIFEGLPSFLSGFFGEKWKQLKNFFEPVIVGMDKSYTWIADKLSKSYDWIGKKVTGLINSVRGFFGLEPMKESDDTPDKKDPTAAKNRGFLDALLQATISGSAEDKKILAQSTRSALGLNGGFLGGALDTMSKYTDRDNIHAGIGRIIDNTPKVNASLASGVAAAKQSISGAFTTPSVSTAWAAVSGSVRDLFKTKDSNVDVANLDPEVKNRFFSMLQDYRNLGGKRKIQINSGYRSTEEQARLYQQNPKKAARPGTSVHELGRAIDIQSADANELDRMGLLSKYGFDRPFPKEAWHVQQAGISSMLSKQGWANQDFPQQNITLPNVSSSANFAGAPSNTRPAAAPFKVAEAPPAQSAINAMGGPFKEPKASRSAGTSFKGSTESIPSFSYLDPALLMANAGALTR